MAILRLVTPMRNQDRRVNLWIATIALLTTSALQADDIEAGRVKANVCSGCHGQDGMSPNDIWPNLAGQRAGYVARQLRAFRSGKRVDPIMATFAAPLTDQDVIDIAAYYASLKPPVSIEPQKGLSP